MERSARMGPLRSRRLTTSPWVPDGAPRTVAPLGGHEPHDVSELGRNSAPLGGRTTRLSVSAGMNDLVIPREQFLDSPFGAAVFLGRNTSYNTSNGAPPLVGSSETNYLTPFGGTRWTDLKFSIVLRYFRGWENPATLGLVLDTGDHDLKQIILPSTRPPSALLTAEALDAIISASRARRLDIVSSVDTGWRASPGWMLPDRTTRIMRKST